MPVQVSRFHQGQRHQILPAYTQDDIILSSVFTGTTDVACFEDSIERLLQHYGRWPEPMHVYVKELMGQDVVNSRNVTRLDGCPRTSMLLGKSEHTAP